jgi:hypothetical protein
LLFNPFLPALRGHVLLASRGHQGLAEPPVLDFGGKAAASEQPAVHEVPTASHEG